MNICEKLMRSVGNKVVASDAHEEVLKFVVLFLVIVPELINVNHVSTSNNLSRFQGP